MARSCSSLDVGCRNSKRGSIGIDYVRGRSADIVADAHFLPFKDEVFDKIVNYIVLENSPSPLNFLKEQHPVLRDDGEILVETDNAQYFAWAVLGSKVGGYKQADILNDHYIIFYPENVRRLLTRANPGERVITISRFGT